jgi:hypothetical protein
MRSTAAEQRGTGIRTHLRAYSESLRGRARTRDFVSRLCAAPLAAQRGRDSPWIPIIFKGLLRAEKGWGSSLYRLPAFCHRDRLIHAGRFFVKKKAHSCVRSAPLRRTGVSAQNPLEAFCVAVSAPLMGMNFFFTKKWVGGRSITKEVPARKAPTPKKIYGNPRGGRSPMRRETTHRRGLGTASPRSCPSFIQRS